MPPFSVTCSLQITGDIPHKKRMIIVSNYQLIEKSPGVFSSVCRIGSFPLLWGEVKDHR